MGDAGTVFVDVLPDLRKFGSSLNAEIAGATGAFSGINRAASAAFGQVAQVAGQAAVAVGLVGVAGAKIGIDTNAGLETAELQFRTLLGSADAARERVASLFEFAKRTPFETEPVIKASRLLQTFGGNALAAEANLRLVGDAAAATNTGIDELAFWVGRAYSQIQGGQPFGEAAMRLQELAVLSPEARTRMEELQKSGADAVTVWSVLQGELGKFGGAMQLQAESWVGLKSTIADFVALTSADVFRPLFDSAKRMATQLLELGDSAALTDLLDQIKSVVAQGSAAAERFVTSVVGRFQNVNLAGAIARFRELGGHIEGLEPLLTGASAAFAAFSLRSVPLVGALLPPWAPIVAAIGGFVLSTDEGREALRGIGEAAMEAGRILAPAIEGSLREIQPALIEFVEALGGLAQEALPVVAQLLASAVPAATEVFSAALRIAVPLMETFADILDAIPDPLIEIVGAAGGAAFAIGKVGSVLSGLGIAGVANPWVLGIGAVALAFGEMLGVFDDGPSVIEPNETAVRNLTAALKENHTVINEASAAKVQELFLGMDDSDRAVKWMNDLGISWSDLMTQLGRGSVEFNQWVEQIAGKFINPEESSLVKNLRQLGADWHGTLTTGREWAQVVGDVALLTDIYNTSVRNLGGSMRADADEWRVSGSLIGPTAEKMRVAVDDANALSAAIREQTGDVFAAAAPLRDLANSTYEAAIQAGLGEEAASQYTAALLGVPADVATKVHNTADLATAWTAIYDAKVRGVPVDWKTIFGADTSAPDDAIRRLDGKVMYGKWFIDGEYIGPSATELAARFGVRLGFSRGGEVPGPSGAGDIVPAMLSPREFVLTEGMRSGRDPIPAGAFTGPAFAPAPLGYAPAASGGGAPLVGQIIVHAGLGADGDDIGRRIVSALRDYEHYNGTDWRTGGQHA